MWHETSSAEELALTGSLSEPGGLSMLAAMEVLEAMFFEIPEGEPCQGEAPGEEIPQAGTRFVGSVTGTFQVAVEPFILQRMTANFLGREDSQTVTPAEQDLVLCELNNMLCGSSLSRMNPTGRIRIDQPHTYQGAWQDDPAANTTTGWLQVPLEEGSLWLRFSYGINA